MAGLRLLHPQDPPICPESLDLHECMRIMVSARIEDCRWTIFGVLVQEAMQSRSLHVPLLITRDTTRAMPNGAPHVLHLSWISLMAISIYPQCRT